MKERLLEVLVCPKCKSELLLITDIEENGEIKRGKENTKFTIYWIRSVSRCE